MNEREYDDFDEIVRRALHEEAQAVEPRDDGLAAIRKRTAGRRPPERASTRQRRTWWGVTAGALATAAVVLGVALAAGMLDAVDPTPDEVDPAGPRPSATAEPAPSPDETPTAEDDPPPSPTPPVDELVVVPVYYLGDTGLGPRLFREFHRVDTTMDPGEAALHQMLTQPPLDPDYSSPWALGSDVLSVSHSGGLISVDLSQQVSDTHAGARVTPDLAYVTVQQLVYTVQAALQSTDPVQILVEGEPVETLFGVPTADPVQRAEQIDVQSPLWITTPSEGSEEVSEVPIGGIANTFEANVPWQVLQGGEVIEEDATIAEGGMGVFSEWSDTVTLEPGTYTLRVFEQSMEDGSLVAEDTKTFTVIDPTTP